ncbi:MAG TPA: enoyl-CoA hydratase-related protein [Burkholderiales bacterium]|jgi:2-(1,2-epoxy-1,2-dihydrophenyl)acetyl-CoA isomerase|nr:enoyl-CoA hydratase-related protein [Burkholderiales bacterium]
MKTLLYEVKDHVARITFNRPDAANALDLQMALDLMHASIRASEDAAVRAVLITGAGKMFSGGGDLKSFAAQGDALPGHLKEVTAYLHAAVSRFVRMDAPVIAAVNGAAGGAGMSLCLFADLVLAAESAKFTMAYTRAGLNPDGSSTYFLPRIVGMRRALELAITNRVLSAKEAHEWGIVTRVVPDAELLTEADSLARQLAAGATRAYGAAKRLLHHSFAESLETQMELEAQAIADAARTRDAREGIAAFIAKRKPDFRGS